MNIGEAAKASGVSAKMIRHYEENGFIPKAANMSLSWRYRGFSSRILYNFTGSHISTYSATSPALNLYRFDRNTWNVGVAYQFRPSLSVTCDVANIFTTPDFSGTTS